LTAYRDLFAGSRHLHRLGLLFGQAVSRKDDSGRPHD